MSLARGYHIEPEARAHPRLQPHVRQANEVPADIRLLCYVFVATIPLEAISLFTNYSIPQIVGLLFAGAVLMKPRRVFQKPSPALLWFLIYVALDVVRYGWLDARYVSYWSARLTQILQLAVFFWISRSLFRDWTIARGALTAFAGSCAVVGVGTRFHLPGFVPEKALEEYGERAAAFATDPNIYAGMMAVAALCVAALLLSKQRQTRRLKIVIAALLMFFLAEIVFTESRGGLIALFVGGMGMVWAVPGGHRRLLKYVLTALSVVLLVVVTLRTSSAEDRWRRATEEGNLAGRERIYPAALAMVAEKPLFGWGPEEHIYVLGEWTGKYRRDTHNMFLWIATELGLTAMVPFAIGVFLCGTGAWRGRKGPLGSLPFGIFLVLLTMNMSVTMLFNKATWLAFALAEAAGMFTNVVASQAQPATKGALSAGDS